MNQGDFSGHVPVLLHESVDALAVRPDGIYLDGTFGRGGHASEVLARLGPDGRLLAFDKDPQAVETALRRFGSDERFSIERGSFAMLARVADQRGLRGRVDGVLLDLGVSSPQFDQGERGFSFLRDGPLDMRMDPEVGESAADWLARAREADIAQVLRVFGEERFAKRIAGAIVRTRAESPIRTTAQLAAIIAAAVPRHEPGKHPATRSFQAIRIHINKELDDLGEALVAALEVLRPGGRLAVISFHSLEDRIVKRFIRDEARGASHVPGMPVPEHMLRRRLRAVGKEIRPGDAELARNPRARSSVLRVAERLADVGVAS
ncbi:MAG: 16S rRNA (cytosine(1402)-N(4))-methyltransferase RsmH [Chromatiales bacterium]|nr:16S rRNA (cytosine(1402)-N(4))-methyltransferase RsmH [Gammaproteobacteria bacterium]MCP5352702.1 16S rRNA (cytosine(1402)-N(4))-methyltransferase RsmH [Chromatiales bacterium]